MIFAQQLPHLCHWGALYFGYCTASRSGKLRSAQCLCWEVARVFTLGFLSCVQDLWGRPPPEVLSDGRVRRVELRNLYQVGWPGVSGFQKRGYVFFPSMSSGFHKWGYISPMCLGFQRWGHVFSMCSGLHGMILIRVSRQCGTCKLHMMHQVWVARGFSLI